MPQADQRALRGLADRVRADSAQLACRAFRTRPDRFEERLYPIDGVEVFGAEPELEIPPSVRFRAESRARQVRAAEIDPRAVDQDRLEVHARADLQLEAAAPQPAFAIEA